MNAITLTDFLRLNLLDVPQSPSPFYCNAAAKETQILDQENKGIQKLIKYKCF